MIMSSDDDQVLHEKRMLDITCVATERLLRDEETSAGRTEEERRRSVKLGKQICVRATDEDYYDNPRSFMALEEVLIGGELGARLEGEVSERSASISGKRKSQQNPNLDHASSSRSVPLESKRRLLVPNDAVGEREPVAQPVVIKDGVFTKPEWLINKMREVNGVGAKMIFEKEITKTDVHTSKTRFLIPWNQIKVERFLTEHELMIIDEHFRKIRDRGVDVILLGSHDRSSPLNLRRWNMTTTSNYVLVTGWNHAAAKHGLKDGDVINLWTFHSQLDGRLYFAIVNHGRIPGFKPLAPNPPPYQNMAIDALPLALVPAPDQAMALDALPLAFIPAPGQAPAQALALVPIAAQASSSSRDRARVRTVRRNREEQYIGEATTLKSGERRRRAFDDFPRRRRSLQVPITPPDSQSEDESQTRNAALYLLAGVCEDELMFTAPDYDESDDGSQSKVTPLDLLARLGVGLLKEIQETKRTNSLEEETTVDLELRL